MRQSGKNSGPSRQMILIVAMFSPFVSLPNKGDQHAKGTILTRSQVFLPFVKTLGAALATGLG